MIYLLNSKISDSHRLLLNVTVKINLKKKDMLLYQILAYALHGKIEKIHIWTINLKNQLQLPDGSYSASDLQDCF